MQRLLWLLVLACLTLAACGDKGSPPPTVDSTQFFSGEKQRVAAAVERYEDALASDDPKPLCALITPAQTRADHFAGGPPTTRAQRLQECLDGINIDEAKDGLVNSDDAADPEFAISRITIVNVCALPKVGCFESNKLLKAMVLTGRDGMGNHDLITLGRGVDGRWFPATRFLGRGSGSDPELVNCHSTEILNEKLHDKTAADGLATAIGNSKFEPTEIEYGSPEDFAPTVDFAAPRSGASNARKYVMERDRSGYSAYEWTDCRVVPRRDWFSPQTILES